MVQIEREEWRLVGLGRSCIVEGIGFEIGEESFMEIGRVSCNESCRESGMRIGWNIGSLG